MERVVIRKTTAAPHWGFEVGCAAGINLITCVELETPAGISGKINAGDEIVEVGLLLFSYFLHRFGPFRSTV